MAESMPDRATAAEAGHKEMADAIRVLAMDESQPRVRIEAEVVHAERLRDFFGFNRAKHAVVEAAILATRTAFLPRAEIEAEYRKLALLVDKTGGRQEKEAFAFLHEHVQHAWRVSGTI